MDSFATSQSFLHAVLSPVLSLMSARQTSADSMGPFSSPPREDRRPVFNNAETEALAGGGWACRGGLWTCPLRSSENRRMDRLKRLNTETQLLGAQRQTDPYHPGLQMSQLISWLVIYLLILNQRWTRFCLRCNVGSNLWGNVSIVCKLGRDWGAISRGQRAQWFYGDTLERRYFVCWVFRLTCRLTNFSHCKLN